MNTWPLIASASGDARKVTNSATWSTDHGSGPPGASPNTGIVIAVRGAGGGHGQCGDAGLGGGVVRLTRRAHQERLGGGVDQPAVDRPTGQFGLITPVGGGVAAQQEVAAQVYPDDQ